MALPKDIKKASKSTSKRKRKPASKKQRNGKSAGIRSEFRSRLSSASKHKDLKLVWQVHAAGAEGTFDERLEIEGAGKACCHLRDEFGKRSVDQQDIVLGSGETESALRAILDAVDEMVPRDQARFLPDSLVGEVTLDINGITETYYFLADEGHARDYEHPPALKAAIRRVSEIVSGAPGKRRDQS